MLKVADTAGKGAEMRFCLASNSIISLFYIFSKNKKRERKEERKDGREGEREEGRKDRRHTPLNALQSNSSPTSGHPALYSCFLALINHSGGIRVIG